MMSSLLLFSLSDEISSSSEVEEGGGEEKTKGVITGRGLDIGDWSRDCAFVICGVALVPSSVRSPRAGCVGRAIDN